MKPTPLKDKIKVLIVNETVKKAKATINNVTKFYDSEDVVAAVAWLKGHYNNMELSPHRAANKLIDEAFPDVVSSE